jgi:hypothetical protein
VGQGEENGDLGDEGELGEGTETCNFHGWAQNVERGVVSLTGVLRRGGPSGGRSREKRRPVGGARPLELGPERGRGSIGRGRKKTGRWGALDERRS